MSMRYSVFLPRKCLARPFRLQPICSDSDHHFQREDGRGRQKSSGFAKWSRNYGIPLLATSRGTARNLVGGDHATRRFVRKKMFWLQCRWIGRGFTLLSLFLSLKTLFSCPTRFLVLRSSPIFLIRARSGQSKALGQLEDVQRSNATPIQSRFQSYPSSRSPFRLSGLEWAAFQITCGANRKTPKSSAQLHENRSQSDPNKSSGACDSHTQTYQVTGMAKVSSS